MVDIEAMLVTWLRADAGVKAQVVARLWGSPGIPRTEVPHMPRKAVVLVAHSGPGADRSLPESVGVVQFRCYGATMAEAWQVYGAVFDALHRAHHQRPATGQMIGVVHEQMHPQSLIEPQTDWPLVLVTFRVRYVTGTVTVG